MGYVGKVVAGGSTYKVGSTLYGTCETAAATAAKVAVIDGFDTLETGVTVFIKFTYSNTAATPTLAIKPSSSGTATTAKSIMRYGTTKPGTTPNTSWQANEVVSFTYDGTQWQMNTTVYTSQSAASGGTDVSLVTTGEKATWNGKAAYPIVSEVLVNNSQLQYKKYTSSSASSTVSILGSKAAVSGGTDVSLVTTGEKYEWDNADLTVDQELSTSSVSRPILMSGASYTDTSAHYTGNIYRNNNVYCNPSTGTINTPGWVVCGTDSKEEAAEVFAYTKCGRIALVAPARDATNKQELLGILTQEVNYPDGTNPTAGDPHYIIFRPSRGGTTAWATKGTYIGGYNYANDWETFLVQGRSGHYWGTIPAVQSSNGILEVGKILDFHIASNSTSDYNYRLTCTGDGAMTYSGSWTKASSRKIKENIEDMDLDEAKELFKLRPVKFDYKEGFGQKDQRGLIAEEVAEVLPKLVVAEVGEEGTEEWCPASVDYIGAVPYLIKIVQEQQKEIDELKAKLAK